MFQLAIAIRLLVFAVFVACVYGGNKNSCTLENSLCNTVFHFPPSCNLCGLACILLWFECLSTCPVCLAGHFCFKTKKIPMRLLL